jgi:hypothetical protein
MTLSEKVLKVVFIILFLVLLGELSFFFWQNYNSFNNKNKTNESYISPSPQENNELITRVPAYNKETLDSLYNLNKDIVKSSIVENIYEGEIIDVKLTNNPLEKNGFKYNFFIRIKNGESTNSFYFNENEIKKINVFNISKEKLSLKDLKTNEQIKIEEKLNLLENIENNLIEINIYLLKQ